MDIMTTPTRRAFLTGAAALAAAPFGGRNGAAQSAATPHTFKVGAAEITVLSDGDFTLPASLMLPGRPEADIAGLYQRAGAAFGPLKAEVNVVVIRTGTDVILVDTGAGPDFMPTLGKLADRLEAARIAPDTVTKVVFTHAHPDHLWGVIDPLGGSILFEKARHLMTATERDFWLKPDVEATVADAFKAMAVGTQRRLKAIADRIEIVAPGQEVAPGVALVDTAGHTPGHVSVLLRSGNEQLLFGGDALVNPVVSFAEPGWRWGSDMDADRAIAARKSLLDRLASERIALLGYHLPWPGIGRVERKESAYRFVQ
jgi:glyoxylase-like metal-dependent hydrolase (beta-lactamase superfamily II)